MQKKKYNRYRAFADGQMLSRKVAKGQVRSYNQQISERLHAHAEQLERLEVQLLELQASHRLFPIPNNKGTYLQLIGDIIYCEAQRGQSDIHCLEQSFEGVSLTLKDLDEQLSPYGFLRVHQSFLVNRRFIRKFYDRDIRLKDGTVIKVSRRFFADIRRSLKTGYL
jgi:DNA-binding LytR/AlgR family response regulator